MAKNISRLSPFFSGRCCPSSVSSLAVKASMHRRFLSAFRSPMSGTFLAVGNSTWSAITRPNRRAASFNPPTSRAATDQLTCTGELLAGNRASHWDRRAVAEDACRSVLGSVMSHSYQICSIGTAGSGSVSVMTSSFQRASLTIAGILFRLRYHCGTRVCSVFVSSKCATHVLRTYAKRKLLGQGACECR